MYAFYLSLKSTNRDEVIKFAITITITFLCSKKYRKKNPKKLLLVSL